MPDPQDRSAVGRAGDDPAPSFEDRVIGLTQDLDSLEEDVEDLGEAVGEFDLFDQCMHVVGVSEYAGYAYEGEGTATRPAFEMAVRGFDPPQYQFLAYPGEEPPSIECNEDAEARPEND
jgi:hypothetical protein